MSFREFIPHNHNESIKELSVQCWVKPETMTTLKGRLNPKTDERTTIFEEEADSGCGAYDPIAPKEKSSIRPEIRDSSAWGNWRLEPLEKKDSSTERLRET